MHPPRSRTLVLCLLSALHAMPTLAATQRGRSAAAVQLLATTPAPAAAPAEVVDTRRQLEQRVLDQPRDMQARLALAQLLASQPATLRSGIVQLSQLARDRTVGAEAIGSWRAALGWAGTDRNDIPLYQAYLKLRPRDAAVRARLAEIERAAPTAAPAAAAVAPPGAAPLPAPVTGTAYIPPVVLPAAGATAPGAPAALPGTRSPILIPEPVLERSSRGA